MFNKLNNNQLIKSQFDTAKVIQVKRNPVTGRPLITNIYTQLYQRVITGNALWKQDGVKEPVEIHLEYFAPARPIIDGVSGKPDKNYTPDIKAMYQQGLPNDEIAGVEFASLLSYFTACFCTGQLPTPAKMSGQSTIMAKIVQNWRLSAGLTPLWIELQAKTGVIMRISNESVERLQTVFVDNFDMIVNTWDTGASQVKGGESRISWL